MFIKERYAKNEMKGLLVKKSGGFIQDL